METREHFTRLTRFTSKLLFASIYDRGQTHQTNSWDLYDLYTKIPIIKGEMAILKYREFIDPGTSGICPQILGGDLNKWISK